MNNSFGHNETAVRLGLLADDAQKALARVASGEEDTIAGWLAYGAALNEGRALFPSDEQFGQWLVNCNLQLTGGDAANNRAAAMWASENPEQFQEAKAAGNARTVRGIHAKWKEILAEREAKAARAQAEQEKAAAEEARRIAQERKAAADAQAAAEEKARRAAQEAKDEAERLAAQERHRTASAAREKAAQEAQEADERASFNEATAHAASIAAQKLEKKLENKKEKTPHVSHNSGENEWYTPAPFIEAARSVMGGIDLDPASSEIANRTVKADQIFTEQDDGLKQDWPIGRIWMNPPYAQPLMGQFANKFASEVRRGSEGVVLVNNATETAWFQTIAAECSAICFPKTRIRFLDPQGNPGAPLQGQAIIYCGPSPDAFEEAFAAFGLVVRHG
jgi:phage N-6-adenine-methyltransferase